MTVNYSKAANCAVFCQQVYQKFDDNIKFDGIVGGWTLINQEKTDTQCAILPNGTNIIIVFRGSDSSVDWDTNLNTQQEQADFNQKVIRQEIVAQQDKVYPYAGESDAGALMHRGFVNDYFSVRDDIHGYMRKHEVSSVTVTGHSLGGALGTLCAVDLQYNFGSQAEIELYTFGSPKVGNNGFRDSFNRRVPNSYRFVYGMDIVPELPRWWQGYNHVDAEFRIGPRFSFNFLSARFKDHAIAQYITALKTLASH